MVALPEMSDAALTFQEDLISERETEIRNVEAGIMELNEIFRELGTLVEGQQGGIGALGTQVDRGNDNWRYVTRFDWAQRAFCTRQYRERRDSTHASS